MYVYNIYYTHVCIYTVIKNKTDLWTGSIEISETVYTHFLFRNRNIFCSSLIGRTELLFPITK